MGTVRPVTKKQIMELIGRGAPLGTIDMRGIDLSGICFDGVDLSMAKLAECNLARSTFRGANLASASLWRADCTDACFDGANLEDADLDFTNLEGTTFRGAKIRKTIFPFHRVTMDQIQTAVRTGRRLKMEPRKDDEWR